MRNLLALTALLLFAGCSTFTVKPGSDPVVVYAEASAEMSATTFDAFLKWERANDAVLRKVDPGIHKVANEIRDNGMRWIRELRAATQTYKAAKTSENKTALLVAQGILDLAIAEVKISTQKGNL
jgi:hypothetical protein